MVDSTEGDATPGAGPLVERIGRFVAIEPMPVLSVTGIVAIALGAAASKMSTEFNSNESQTSPSPQTAGP